MDINRNEPQCKATDRLIAAPFGHTIVVGTPRAGKTRLLSRLMSNACLSAASAAPRTPTHRA